MEIFCRIWSIGWIQRFRPWMFFGAQPWPSGDVSFLGDVFSCARAPNPSWTPDSKLRIKFRCPKGNAFARACQGPIRASILFLGKPFPRPVKWKSRVQICTESWLAWRWVHLGKIFQHHHDSSRFTSEYKSPYDPLRYCEQPSPLPHNMGCHTEKLNLMTSSNITELHWGYNSCCGIRGSFLPMVPGRLSSNRVRKAVAHDDPACAGFL